MYDMAKRQPLYANADATLLWELTTFVNHYHPTVRKFAAHIINAQSIPYDGTLFDIQDNCYNLFAIISYVLEPQFCNYFESY